MVKKAVEVKGIRKIVRAFLKKYDPEWSDWGCAFSYMLQDNNLAKMWVYIEGDRVIDFMNIYNIEKQVIVSPYFMDNYKVAAEIKSIGETFGDVIIEADYLDVEECDIIACSLKSTIDDTKEYYMSGCGAFYTNSEKLVDFFVQYFENEYFPVLENLDDITYKIVGSKEVHEYGTDEILGRTYYPNWKDRYGHHTIIGFHYFKAEDSPNAKYLIATYKEKAIGVIKLGKYGQGKEARQSICYIDVNSAYRQRGVAKRMIKELGKYLDPNLPLMVTDESDLGSLCRMMEHFKQAGYSVPVYSFREFYERRAV